MIEIIVLLVIILCCLYFFFLEFIWKKRTDKKLLNKYEEGIKNGTIKNETRQGFPKGFDSGFDFGTTEGTDRKVEEYGREYIPTRISELPVKPKGRFLFQNEHPSIPEPVAPMPISDFGCAREDSRTEKEGIKDGKPKRKLWRRKKLQKSEEI